MCMVCGKVWCEPNCPLYEEAADPALQGWCVRCGEPVFAHGAEMCNECEEDVYGNQ